MWLCPICGEPQPEEVTYCHSCGYGAPLESTEAMGIEGSYEVREGDTQVQCTNCGIFFPLRLGVCPQCGTPIGASMSQDLSPFALPVGTKLKGEAYTVDRVLRQGGLGITYMGTDQGLQRPVAIKEFFPYDCMRQGSTVVVSDVWADGFARMKNRFLQEAHALTRFNHPGLVRVYDVFEENNTAYVVMEYLPGKTLDRLLEERGEPLEEEEAVGYIEQVAEGLRVMHEAGWVHLNVKPGNIMVTSEGRVVLLVSGFACPFQEGQSESEVILTPSYAPPEQYARGARLGPYTDIYALGATLYALLTGQVPVEATDRAAGVVLRPPHEVNPKVSRRVSEAVLKAMALRVDERPQDVRAFVALLRRSE